MNQGETRSWLARHKSEFDARVNSMTCNTYHLPKNPWPNRNDKDVADNYLIFIFLSREAHPPPL